MRSRLLAEGQSKAAQLARGGGELGGALQKETISLSPEIVTPILLFY